MNIQLLGSVTVHTVEAGQKRVAGGCGRLLASLAWTPGAFLADEVVIDRIWQDRAQPEDPRGALYILATRLRKILGERLTREAGGYLLNVDEDSVDVARFRALARRAHVAYREGMAEKGLRAYDEALALWRGEPMTDIRAPWADAARVTMEHEYREALVAVTELSLLAGRPGERISALHHFTESHPLDERVTGLLMAALHRDGRRAEALQQFRCLRRRTIDFLGCEPGPELQELNRSLLVQGEPAESAVMAHQLAQPSGKWSAMNPRSLSSLSAGGFATV
ncbi:AfsR/SARP family transcriptional regulator [Streptomyces fragilis]|uniref:AfsR/SARP family transcriptional regulator n=1 Tax=Streptomyces fragilis TaxID=67301 RepID=A0ABV2YCU4_9ACTN|nr:AfsR/SARP family transcriptional regulator [Streptomyces fragilis]